MHDLIVYSLGSLEAVIVSLYAGILVALKLINWKSKYNKNRDICHMQYACASGY